MDASEIGLTITKTNGAQVIIITDSLIDRISVGKVGTCISEMVDQAEDGPKVVICFEQIKEVSSAILGAVIQIDKQISRKHGQLKLSGMQPSVKEVFHLTRLDSILDIHDTAELALDSFEN